MGAGFIPNAVTLMSIDFELNMEESALLVEGGLKSRSGKDVEVLWHGFVNQGALLKWLMAM